jgi:hypothetical protein
MMQPDHPVLGYLADVVGVFTGSAPVRADAAEFNFLSPGDVVEHLYRPGERQTIVRVWRESDGTGVADIRDRNGTVLTAPRSWLRPVPNG